MTRKTSGLNTVPNGTHGVGHQIKQYTGGQTPYDEDEITICIVEDFRRRTQNPQQRACGKALQQESQPAGAANSCQCIAAKGTSYDKGICHIIKLLK